MATIRQRKSGTWEVIVRNKLLPKPYYATLDSEAEAIEYAAKIEALLADGVVPVALREDQPVLLVGVLIHDYIRKTKVSAHDLAVLPRIPDSLRLLPVDKLTVNRLLQWITEQQESHSAPGTIRKKIGALARVCDWAVLTGALPSNQLRLLPRNYAAYPSGCGVQVFDIERDRRLQEGEEERLRDVLRGRHDWLLLFDLALETAMRLREMFTLEWSQVNLDKKTIFLDKTKNGDKRQVPMSSTIHSILSGKINDNKHVFKYWDGSVSTLEKTTARLSHQWARIARDAGCVDLRFHDLRHEATCRLYERTTLSDLQISRITGHKSLSMLRRYANLRGSDLSALLW